MSKKYRLRVASGHYYKGKQRLSKGDILTSNLPLHLTIKNKLELLEEIDIEEKPAPIIIEPEIAVVTEDRGEVVEMIEPEVVEPVEVDDDDDYIDLPLSMVQVSSRKWNVLDADGKVIKEKIYKKDAEALIKEYEDAAE